MTDRVALYGERSQRSGWRCECGDLNGFAEAFCYRCGAGQPAHADEARVYDAAVRERGICPVCGDRIKKGDAMSQVATVQLHGALVCPLVAR